MTNFYPRPTYIFLQNVIEYVSTLCHGIEITTTTYIIIFMNFSTQFIFRVHVEESSAARGLDLVFRSIQSSDEGEYSCEAIIDGRKEQQFFYLKVIGKTYFFLIFLNI